MASDCESSTIVGTDKALLAIAFVAYVLFIWVACALSLYMVFTRKSDKVTEQEFNVKWYRWRVQYIYHEIWYRFHIIIIFGLVV